MERVLCNHNLNKTQVFLSSTLQVGESLQSTTISRALKYVSRKSAKKKTIVERKQWQIPFANTRKDKLLWSAEKESEILRLDIKRSMWGETSHCASHLRHHNHHEICRWQPHATGVLFLNWDSGKGQNWSEDGLF